MPLLFEAAVITAVIGALWLFLLRFWKGTLPPSFGEIDLRLPGLFVLALALQLLFGAAAIKGVTWAQHAFPWVNVISYVVLLYAALRNSSHLFGMKIALIGIALNLLVISANLGRMPADLSLLRSIGRADIAALTESGRYPKWRPLTEDSRLPFLGDIFVLQRPYLLRPSPFSPGDLFITVGACWLILSTLGLLPQNLGTSGKKEKVEES
jgi:hypothetical protein